MLLLLLVLTQSNDVAQYLGGESLGRRKLAPKVSPGKTWAGFLGGLGTTIGLSLLLGSWLTMLDLHGPRLLSLHLVLLRMIASSVGSRQVATMVCHFVAAMAHGLANPSPSDRISACFSCR